MLHMASIETLSNQLPSRAKQFASRALNGQLRENLVDGVGVCRADVHPRSIVLMVVIFAIITCMNNAAAPVGHANTQRVVGPKPNAAMLSIDPP